MPNVTLDLEESDRQLVLLALAVLSLRSPGFDDALNRIAIRIDNVSGERAKTYDNFRVCRGDIESPYETPPPLLWFADQGIYSGHRSYITEDMVYMADVIIHNNVVIKNRFGHIDVRVTDEAVNDLRKLSLESQKEFFTGL